MKKRARGVVGRELKRMDREFIGTTEGQRIFAKRRQMLEEMEWPTDDLDPHASDDELTAEVRSSPASGTG
jgi:hypothetical protein